MCDELSVDWFGVYHTDLKGVTSGEECALTHLFYLCVYTLGLKCVLEPPKLRSTIPAI